MRRSDRRRGRRRPLVLAAAGLVLLGASGLVLGLGDQTKAAADASGPPAYSALTDCPAIQNPPAGYAAGGAFYSDRTDQTTVKSHLGAGSLGYMIPFRGTIGSEKGVDGATTSNAGGEIVVPSTNANTPALIIPHIYGVVCGLIDLPELTGIIFNDDVKLGPINAYIGSSPQTKQAYPDAIEALPLVNNFGTLTAGVVAQPAHNGGLDATLGGSTSATISLDGTPGVTPNALGVSCPLNITSVTFSTKASASVNGVTVSGQPVTGPVMNGQAQVVSNPFAIPAIQVSKTCPAVVANAVNKLLSLPLAAGKAVFVAPFTFDFELPSS